MSGNWRTLALASVKHEHIESALRDCNLAWNEVSHITATTSLCNSIRESGGQSHPISQLIEMIVLPSMPKPYRLDLFEFPDALSMRADSKNYNVNESKWRAAVSARQMEIGLEFNQKYRDFISDTPIDRKLKEILRREKRTVRRGIQTLMGSGFGSEDFGAHSSIGETNSISAAAVEAWKYLESNFKPLSAYKDVLWVNLEEYKSQTSQQAANVRKNILNALEVAYGRSDIPRTIVHHGFYFYTPPQWALFQLLRSTPNINQIFIVHDDQTNPAFETWRKYFRSEWEMPETEYIPTNFSPTKQAQALQGLLSGSKVDFEALSDAVEILECRTPADFTRHWIQSSAEAAISDSSPKLYAAQPEVVERFVELDYETGSTPKTNLAYLPVGIFLLGVHKSIDLSDFSEVRVNIDARTLVDIAATGFIEGSLDENRLVSSLERALPYFKGCSSIVEWRNRTSELKDAVENGVWKIQKPPETESDLNRINGVISNPIRMAPWIDFKESELTELLAFLQGSVDLIEEIAFSGTATLETHLAFIKEKLQSGLRNEPTAVRDEIYKKLGDFTIGARNKYDVEGLTELVEILLGQTAEFSGVAEDESDFSAMPLRHLDALGFKSSTTSVLVANLSDNTFPSEIDSIPWPFDLRQLGLEADSPSREILEARSRYSALSELYLLWLALDGVDEGAKIVLSWISDMMGEIQELSGLIKLFLRPERLPAGERTIVGGLVPSAPPSIGDIHVSTPPVLPVSPNSSDQEVADSIAALSAEAIASAYICPRRFAIQWAVGPCAGFQSEHMQQMMYGNIRYVIYKKNGLAWDGESEELRDEVWPFLTEGQKRSSEAKRGIRGSNANLSLIFTIQGSKSGFTPFDIASQAANGKQPKPSVSEVSDSSLSFLPPGVRDEKLCNMCPVSPRCSHAHLPGD